MIYHIYRNSKIEEYLEDLNINDTIEFKKNPTDNKENIDKEIKNIKLGKLKVPHYLNYNINLKFYNSKINKIISKHIKGEKSKNSILIKDSVLNNVKIQGFETLKLINCKIKNNKDDPSRINCDNVTIKNCIFNNQKNNEDGMLNFHNCNNATVKNCKFKGNNSQLGMLINNTNIDIIECRFKNIKNIFSIMFSKINLNNLNKQKSQDNWINNYRKAYINSKNNNPILNRKIQTINKDFFWSNI